MKRYHFYLMLAIMIIAALPLAACNRPQPERVIQVSPTKQQSQPPRSVIDQVDDYGFIPELGCNVKWVWTNTHPNFWLVQCPGSKTQTQYEQGTKSKTYGSAAVDPQ